jgi:hypothetical protein
MSYADKIKQRQYQRDWMHKNRGRYKDKERARMIAWRKNMTPQRCEVTNCLAIGERHHDDYEKPEVIRWLCRKHHQGDFHSKACSVYECDHKHLAKGYCNKHYKIFVLKAKRETLPYISSTIREGIQEM